MSKMLQITEVLLYNVMPLPVSGEQWRLKPPEAQYKSGELHALPKESDKETGEDVCAHDRRDFLTGKRHVIGEGLHQCPVLRVDGWWPRHLQAGVLRSVLAIATYVLLQCTRQQTATESERIGNINGKKNRMRTVQTRLAHTKLRILNHFPKWTPCRWYFTKI